MVQKKFFTTIVCSLMMVGALQGVQVEMDGVKDAEVTSASIVMSPSRDRVDELAAAMPAQQAKTNMIHKGVMAAVALGGLYVAGRWAYQYFNSLAPVASTNNPGDAYRIDGQIVVAHDVMIKAVKDLQVRNAVLEAQVNPPAWSAGWLSKTAAPILPFVGIMGGMLASFKDVDNQLNQANFDSFMKKLQALVQYSQYFDEFIISNQLPGFMQGDPVKLMGLIVLISDNLVQQVENIVAYIEFRAAQLPEEAEMQKENAITTANYLFGLTTAFTNEINSLLTRKESEPKSMKALVIDFATTVNVIFETASLALSANKQ